MKFENTQVFNIEGAMRGMRFPMKGVGDTQGDLIGDKDLDLSERLYHASEVDNLAHSKFLRQILVSVDITAPLFFYSEFDTYKVGTTANSESTMHRILKDIENLSLEDFELSSDNLEYFSNSVIPRLKEISLSLVLLPTEKILLLKEALPTSYLQKRHWTANYEIIRNMYRQRKNHRLPQWNTDFVNWVESLPYSDRFLTLRSKGGEVL